MSWFTDPELFICYTDYGCVVARIRKKVNVPLVNRDLTDEGRLDFSKHLALGDNKESDYDALKSILAKNSFVNCQGSVVSYDYAKSKGTWSRVHDPIFYSLPGIIINSFDTVGEKLQAIEEKVSELIAENSLLKDKLSNEVTKLQAQVSDLTAKLQECSGAGGGSAEPWMSGCSVPSNWVPFEELDLLNIPTDAPLTITEGGLEFGKDTTTNVQANHFHQGIFPIVVVNVADLNPNNGKARFDPDVWCSLNNAGNYYAARKPSVI